MVTKLQNNFYVKNSCGLHYFSADGHKKSLGAKALQNKADVKQGHNISH